MTLRTPMTAAPVRTACGVVLIRPSRCKGCELCVAHCPVGVLALSTDYNDAGYHYPTVANDGCIACQACSAICPDFAIFAIPADALPQAGKPTMAV